MTGACQAGDGETSYYYHTLQVCKAENARIRSSRIAEDKPGVIRYSR